MLQKRNAAEVKESHERFLFAYFPITVCAWRVVLNYMHTITHKIFSKYTEENHENIKKVQSAITIILFFL